MSRKNNAVSFTRDINDSKTGRLWYKIMRRDKSTSLLGEQMIVIY